MKTNKTKPIKKLMVFTIITVMIVSLFAVPSYADEPQITNLIGTTWRITTDVSFADIPAEYGYFKVICDGTLFGYENGEFMSANADTLGFLLGYTALVGDVPSYPNSGSSMAYMEIANNGDYGLVPLGNGMVPYFGDGAYYEFTITGGDDITNPLFIDFINTYGTLVSGEADGEEQGIFAVWSKITQWIVQGLASVSNAFYADGKLTLLGTLCIIPIALGIAFLLIAIIQKFLRLRG